MGTAPCVHLGAGRIGRLSELLAQMGARSVLLVTGGESFAVCGAADVVNSALAGKQVERFTGVRPNPRLDQVELAVTLLRRRPCDVVLGVGGGSTLDVAKLAACLAVQPHPAAEYVTAGRNLDRSRSAGLILVPTTAGSGSEATRFATVYHDGRKYSVDHPGMRADAAIIDPELTRSQPAAVAAASGLDALSHAVESLWATKSTVRSRSLAKSAIRLLARYFLAGPGVFGDAGHAAVTRAAFLAGQAIDITRTTAAHAFAYPLTAHFGLAHGHACALNLAWVLPFNSRVTASDAVDARGADFVRARVSEAAAMLGAASAEEACGALLARVAALGLGPSLASAGVREEDLDRIVSDGLASNRAGNNPRRLTATAARAGLRGVLQCA